MPILPQVRYTRLRAVCAALLMVTIHTAGQFRFQAPRSPSTIKGVQIADTAPAECPQGGEGQAVTTPFTKRQSTLTEDCLFLK